RRQLLRPEPVDLGATLHEIEPILQRLVGEGIRLATNIALDARSVQIDRAQIELALVELVSNASDAMESGGTLTLGLRPMAARDVHSKGLAPGEYVELTVRDTG